MLALTPGEPAGIGIDLVVRICQAERSIPLVVIVDPELLQARAGLLNLPLDIHEYNNVSVVTARGTVSVLPCPIGGSMDPGRLDPANVPGLLAALDRAIAGCLDGEFDGLVTGPMQKSVVNDAGVSFSGHTEYLAEKSAVEDVVMLLANDRMRVALATTHLPLKEVSGALTTELLERRLRILHLDLINKFAIDVPRILVAGLNPHAGENGYLGDEEIRVIEPVCEKLRREGMRITGPLPADTLFTSKYLEACDAVMSMYHDQGLPVLKYSGFGEAVNVTLGLPFVRTSVDHGTALDVAGTGAADPSSMKYAIDLAGVLTAS